MGASASLLNAVDELAKSFNGQLLKPNDLDYETARKVHNGVIDKRPASSPAVAAWPTSWTRQLGRAKAWRSPCAAAATTWRAAARSTAA